jgi:hypothetical protein
VSAFAVDTQVTPPETLERWNAGTLERWNAGTLERWNAGALGRWDAGTLDFGTVQYSPSEFHICFYHLPFPFPI